jgi:predicted nucleotidyltransferase
MAKPILKMDEKTLAAFCGKHHILRLSLYGSQCNSDARPDSDIDFLIEFIPGREPGLMGLAQMEAELSILLGGHRVDLRTPKDLSRYFRDEVVRSSQVQYAR